MMKNEKILVLYSGKCNTTILQINEDDCGNTDVARLSPNYDVMITEKAYDLVKDILFGIGISMPDAETSSDDTDRTSDLVKTIQDEINENRMRLVDLLNKLSSKKVVLFHLLFYFCMLPNRYYILFSYYFKNSYIYY